MENREIANTILAQMKAIDMNLILCMGVNSPQVINRGLQFKVNGLVHKGFVRITLNGLDLYDISLVKVHRKQSEFFKSMGKRRFEMTETVMSEHKNVSVDEMMRVLAISVEGRP